MLTHVLELEAFLCEKFARFAMNPDNQVLEHAHRTDYRAIDATQKQGEQDYTYNNCKVKGKQGRQKLEFCHPAPAVVPYAQKQQGYPYQEQRRQNNSTFLKHGQLIDFFAKIKK
jgi:hypothetical protein